MHKSFVNLLFVSLLALVIVSCKSPGTGKVSQNQGNLLFRTGGTPVYTDEFAYVYKKNNFNNDSAFHRTDVQEYLDLFINFKLKIKEAQQLGMDTTASFVSEFNTYKSQLTKPYLSESGVTEKLKKEAYERYKQEVKASHILIRVAKEAAPSDTLTAYNKALEIREKAVGGEDFSALAKTYSEDPSAKTNGGDLGYFTSMQMVYPFEDAAYKTNIGDISMPVRTRFGYHIIKVLGKRPSRGKVEVSHIMIRATERSSKEDATAARDKIFEIHEQLVGGAEWNYLCEQFSEDLNTKSKGGKLSPFGTGAMPKEFEEASFALAEVGEISDPFTTAYGWHIVKLESQKGLAPYEEMEPTIKSAINRDARASLNKKALIKRLKKENPFQSDKESLKMAMGYADSTLIKGEWKYNEDSQDLNKTVFSISDKKYSVKDFFDYVIANQASKPSYNPEYYMSELYKQFEEESVIGYEEEHLAEKYVDYRMLLKEYKEGILLFQLMDEKVWSKAVKDTTGLKTYYETNKGKYQWKERAKATIYNASSQDVINRLKKVLDEADTIVSKRDLQQTFNADKALTLDIQEGKFEKGKNAALEKVSWAPGTYTVMNGERVNYVVIEEILSVAPKKLDEIKGEVISDYQNHLEKKWIQNLKVKYPVEVNQKELQKMLSKFEKDKL